MMTLIERDRIPVDPVGRVVTIGVHKCGQNKFAAGWTERECVPSRSDWQRARRPVDAI
jgi:hypothetical protein